jgi:hypothetical protein
MNPKDPPEASRSPEEHSQSIEQSKASSKNPNLESPPIVRVVHEAIREELRFFSGPLPPPEVLAEYNKVFPDCAKMIVEMAQRSSNIVVPWKIGKAKPTPDWRGAGR